MEGGGTAGRKLTRLRRVGRRQSGGGRRQSGVGRRVSGLAGSDCRNQRGDKRRAAVRSLAPELGRLPLMTDVVIRRALISVSDKAGLVAFATKSVGSGTSSTLPSGGEIRPGAVGGSATALTRKLTGALQSPCSSPSPALADQKKMPFSARGLSNKLYHGFSYHSKFTMVLQP